MLFNSVVLCLLVFRIYAESKYGETNYRYNIDQQERENEYTDATPKDRMPPNNLTAEMANTMTCEEFMVNYTFDPFKVIDIDWRIWYIWNPHYEEPFTIKFSLASKILVDRFRVELDKELKPQMNWDDAVLFMETSVDFSALFIKTEEDGIFRVVPSLAFEYYRIPVLRFALKLIEPHGYLAIVNCKYRLAYALAPADKVPHYLTYAEEAKKIGFRSNFGQSSLDYLVKDSKNYPRAEDIPDLHDDDDEDVHVDYLSQYNADMESKLM